MSPYTGDSRPRAADQFRGMRKAELLSFLPQSKLTAESSQQIEGRLADLAKGEVN
jgi:hypothetical protein